MASFVAVKVCRVCLASSCIAHSVWDSCGERVIAALIYEHLNLEIDQDSQLPQFICCTCLRVLEEINTLRRIAQRNAAVLNHNGFGHSTPIFTQQTPDEDTHGSHYYAFPINNFTSGTSSQHIQSFIYRNANQQQPSFKIPTDHSSIYNSSVRLIPTSSEHQQYHPSIHSVPIPIPAYHDHSAHSMQANHFEASSPSSSTPASNDFENSPWFHSGFTESQSINEEIDEARDSKSTVFSLDDLELQTSNISIELPQYQSFRTSHSLEDASRAVTPHMMPNHNNEDSDPNDMINDSEADTDDKDVAFIITVG